jgi:hypothetical protein
VGNPAHNAVRLTNVVLTNTFVSRGHLTLFPQCPNHAERQAGAPS